METLKKDSVKKMVASILEEKGEMLAHGLPAAAEEKFRALFEEIAQELRGGVDDGIEILRDMLDVAALREKVRQIVTEGFCEALEEYGLAPERLRVESDSAAGA